MRPTPEKPFIPRGPQRIAKVWGALAWTAERYAAALQDPHVGAAARAYLAARGYTNPAWLAAYGVGYAVGHGLAAGWRAEDGGGAESDASLIEAGVLFEPTEERPTPGEFFRQRITFTVTGPSQKIIPTGRGGTWYAVAFNGRSLGDERPKYLNTRETPAYTKGAQLYGHGWAMSAIRAQHTVVVVEGCFDVLRCHQIGATEVVAPLGTALTAAQVAAVHAGVPDDEPVNWVFCLDGDQAGVNAVLRGAGVVLEALRPESTIRVMTLPGGKDPDAVLGAALSAGDDPLAVWTAARQGALPIAHAVVAGPARAQRWDGSLDGLLGGLRRAQTLLGHAPESSKVRVNNDIATALQSGGFSPTRATLAADLQAPQRSEVVP